MQAVLCAERKHMVIRSKLFVHFSYSQIEAMFKLKRCLQTQSNGERLMKCKFLSNGRSYNISTRRLRHSIPCIAAVTSLVVYGPINCAK
jgi:hypothetical protein